MLTPYIQRSPRKLQPPRSFGNAFLGFRFRGSGWKTTRNRPYATTITWPPGSRSARPEPLVNGANGATSSSAAFSPSLAGSPKIQWESPPALGSLSAWGAAPQECHTKADRRTEKRNKINIKQDRYLSSILSGSTIPSLEMHMNQRSRGKKRPSFALRFRPPL